MLYIPIKIPKETEERRNFLTTLTGKEIMINRSNKYEIGNLQYDKESGEFYLTSQRNRFNLEQLTELFIRF